MTNPFLMDEENEAKTNTFSKEENLPQWPIRGASKFSGEFGQGDARHQKGKSKEELEKYHGHKGTDVVGVKGEAVYPMLPGIVTRTIQDPKTWKPPNEKTGDPGNNKGSQGNMIVIDHPSYGITTKYLHLESISVSAGQEVTKNTQIGTCGNTGSASVTGPHVHFEVIKGGQWINARPIIEGKKQLAKIEEQKKAVATTKNIRMKLFAELAKKAIDRFWEDED
jgi:murein DD-endopeptidase MepM/ murein hydrolase activator NlpD